MHYYSFRTECWFKLVQLVSSMLSCFDLYLTLKVKPDKIMIWSCNTELKYIPIIFGIKKFLYTKHLFFLWHTRIPKFDSLSMLNKRNNHIPLNCLHKFGWMTKKDDIRHNVYSITLILLIFFCSPRFINQIIYILILTQN